MQNSYKSMIERMCANEELMGQMVQLNIDMEEAYQKLRKDKMMVSRIAKAADDPTKSFN